MPRIELPESAADFDPAPPGQRTSAMERFPPAPEPNTELGRYRILAPKAGVRVSPLALGGMSLGDQWTGYMGGGLSPSEAEKILDLY